MKTPAWRNIYAYAGASEGKVSPKTEATAFFALDNKFALISFGGLMSHQAQRAQLRKNFLARPCIPANVFEGTSKTFAGMFLSKKFQLIPTNFYKFHLFQRSPYLSLNVPLLDCLSFIIFLLSTSNSDFNLEFIFSIIHRNWYDCQATLFFIANKFRNLFFV